MRVVGQAAWVAVAGLALAGVFDVWSRWYAKRMAAQGEGWEMAFYFSPAAFRLMDGLLLTSAIVGIVGLLVGPRWYHRILSASVGLAGGTWFLLLPWR